MSEGLQQQQAKELACGGHFKIEEMLAAVWCSHLLGSASKQDAVEFMQVGHLAV